TQRTAEDWFNEGVDLIRLRKTFDAIKCFEVAVELDSQFIDAWFYLGTLNEQICDNPPGIVARQDFYKKAIEAYKKIVELDPQNVKAWNQMGYNYDGLAAYTPNKKARTEYYEKSRNCFKRVVEIDPQYKYAWSNLGNSYWNLGDFAKAAESYLKAIEVNPKDTVVWYNLGETQEKLGNLREALKTFEKVQKLDPSNVNAAISIKKLKSRIQDAKVAKTKTSYDSDIEKPKIIHPKDLAPSERESLETILLEFIHKDSGCGKPRIPHCHFEDLNLERIEEYSDGVRMIIFNYMFDEDGFSQYDKTIGFKGWAKIDTNGKLVEKELKVVHIGVAAHFEPK
ncbi:MAG: tetratricopeptide repeat protein, partial [Candidatus Hodarchaeota archaeon]